MSKRALPLVLAVTFPWSLLHCGSSNDLVIGGVELPTSVPDAGTGGGTPGGSSGADGGAAGSGGGEAGSSSGQAGGAGTPGSCPSSGATLAHRYSFEGTGSEVTDSVGSAHGTLWDWDTGAGVAVQGALDGSGVLTLDGVDDYVDLPNGLISSLSDATFVVWTAWEGGAGYQRVFDFGTSTLGEDQREHGESYVALIPFTRVADDRHIAVELDTLEQSRIQVASPLGLEEGVLYQLAVVVRSAQQVELYLDSRHVGTSEIAMALADIDDVNNWLGRSQWDADHNYNGSLQEFRIYSGALSPCEIEATFNAGPESP